ncbi:hypothetical protein EDD16DRAFT_219517 [Pisolithus croceorrhizus]|nr:hypothetical protein EV401DRAFT_109348 [Pisolithus croceorrhizus]KAI6127926.1 hypothetical protein EDD16DRAFT_219517 [Pisolithus croceorrhizus]KAI6158534.1 hypothetical protein EDD17DRAFT_1000922 [Pisolithus thermaeus]
MVDEWLHEPEKICLIRRQDIARFVRTCKAFKDPALDFVWRTQPSLGPLIMCLPGHLWTVQRANFDPVVVRRLHVKRCLSSRRRGKETMSYPRICINYIILSCVSTGRVIFEIGGSPIREELAREGGMVVQPSPSPASTTSTATAIHLA